MPDGAIRQKMSMDEVDPIVLEYVVFLKQRRK